MIKKIALLTIVTIALGGAMVDAGPIAKTTIEDWTEGKYTEADLNAEGPIIPLYTPDFAFLSSNDPNAEELAAKAAFQEMYPAGQIITPEQLFGSDEAEPYLDVNVVVTLWVHADRAGLEKGWRNLAKYYVPGSADAASDDDINKFRQILNDFAKDTNYITQKEGKPTRKGIYFSGHATQFVEGIGRISSTYAINIYGSNANVVTPFSDVTRFWAISPWVNDAHHANGNFNHAIYGTAGQNNPNFKEYEKYYFRALSTDEQDGHTVFPTLGPAEGVTLKVDDNNCMWEVANIDDFRKDTNSQPLGTWGQNAGNVSQLGIVEFLNDDASTHPEAIKAGYNANIIANGLACCQWSPDPADGNIYNTNLKKLTFNTLNYLRGEYLTNPNDPTSVDEISYEPEQCIEPIYYTIDGRCISNPQKGNIYIVVKGAKVSKVVL